MRGKYCYEQVLDAASEIVRRMGRNEFTTHEVIDFLRDRGTKFKDTTISTHVVSRCCVNAPDNHATTYKYFERIASGTYRVIGI